MVAAMVHIYTKKYYHEVQEKVLEYIIKNHPDKIREVEYQSPVVISKNKLYPKEEIGRASCRERV
jgi:hypothetical protein